MAQWLENLEPVMPESETVISVNDNKTPSMRRSNDNEDTQKPFSD